MTRSSRGRALEDDRDDNDEEERIRLQYGPPRGIDDDLDHPGVEERIERWRYAGPQT
ncbi:hypothetical protein LG943_09360 [Streptomonospora sp. S1-112]|uniref:Uncharacterized protein n=1 Tax=Streptomonospora mangrovi TaxID=2883123 RepID=A0A9X3NJP9_9ACTN|nr:hypothetical protein [Streptomonospora mangrovi]MDA0564533.1 hypothetical protein [Streptomonospora mangrovi]